MRRQVRRHPREVQWRRKVERAWPARNEKLIIHELYLFFILPFLGTFSAVGEREAMNCLELSRPPQKP